MWTEKASRLMEKAHFPAKAEISLGSSGVTLIPRPIKFSLRETAQPI